MTLRLLLTGLLMTLAACGPRASSGNATTQLPSPESIPGNYSMKMTVDGQTRYSTAIIQALPDGSFQIARITVYGPVLYSFNMADGRRLLSPELGQGDATYQPNLKKTTIRFTKEGALCELSR